MSDRNEEQHRAKIKELADVCRQEGLTPIHVKAQPNFDLVEVEFNGKLLVVRGWITAFGKTRETTWVYKKLT